MNELEEKAAQARELSELERAAQRTADPNSIRQEAGRRKRRPIDFSDSDKWWLIINVSLLVLLVGAHFFLAWKEEWFDPKMLPRIHSAVQGGMLVFFILSIGRLIEIFGIGRLESAVSRFNLKRIFRLLMGLAVILIGISVLFVNWYTAVVSLGLISLVLGFALQTPISSFIGWIYILTRAPYRVGDRIKIDDARGDVIDVGYLDTTLWEFRGDYLSTDHPTGRIIKFPNTKVFSSPVYNLWKRFGNIAKSWQKRPSTTSRSRKSQSSTSARVKTPGSKPLSVTWSIRRKPAESKPV